MTLLCFSFGHEGDGLTEDVRLDAERLKRCNSLFRNAGKPLARAFNAVKRNEGCLTSGFILTGALADRLRSAFSIKKVIGDLKGKTERFRIGGKSCQCRIVRTSDETARPHGIAYERARLHALKAAHVGLRQRRRLCRQIERLPARHPVPAGRSRQFADKTAAQAGIGMRRWIRKNIEGRRQQRIARKNGCRLIKGDMDGRLAASEIIIVHGGQVVMDQTVAMNAFKRRTRPQGRRAACAKKTGGFDKEKRPETLAAVECAVPHRRDQTADGIVFFRTQMGFEKGLDTCRRIAKSCVKRPDFAFSHVHRRYQWPPSLLISASMDHSICRIRPILPRATDVWLAAMPHTWQVSRMVFAIEKGRDKRKGSALFRVIALVLGIIALVPLSLGLIYSVIPPPFSALMLIRKAEGYPIDQRWVSLDAVSPHLPAAIIMSEDARFCRHGGVDWEALQDVIKEAEDGLPERGASTIAMQTARNMFLWPNRSVIRKGIEIPLALYIDIVWSKRRLMEVYVNFAEWGPGIFGVEAAARHHFGKTPANLTRREAALLAAALPNPFVRNAGRPGPHTRRIAGIVQTRMRSAAPWTDCL